MDFPTLDLEALLRVPYVEPENGFDLSPDGVWAAFAWNRSGRWEIYETRLDAPGEPHQVSSGPGAKTAPRYAPDGKRLAYMVDVDGGEAFDLWVCDLETGITRNLTPDTEFVLQPSYAWFPDGRRIACISEHSGKLCTHILEIDGASLAETQPVLVCDGPQSHLSLSKDGRRLAVVSEGRGQDHQLYVVVLEAGAAAWVVGVDGEAINALDPAWSPDGRRLAFSSDRPGSYQIGICTPQSSEILWLSSGEGDHSAPEWSPDGERVACVVSAGPDTWLALFSLADGTVRRCQVEPGVTYPPTFTPDGRGLVFVFDSPRFPDDLWRLDADSGEFQQLTNSLPEELRGAGFVMPEHIRYPSGDGQDVPALLYLPGGRARCRAEKPPAVVVIHGGPSWLFQFLWYPVMSHLASRGWVVLAPNYRGSTGYGRTWQLANRFEMGRLDTQDVNAGAEYLAREGLADARRIAVTGRSHGGYLTISCLVIAPALWAGGSAVVPFLNWFTSHAASRDDLKHWDIENMGHPEQYAELWHERSPFFYLERIQAPVQLIGGANDPRCPPGEAIAAHEALIELGKEAELLLYPDEGHAFLKIENVIDHELRRVAFLTRILS